AEQSRAEQSRAEQSRAEQSRAEQSRAEQSRAEQSRAEQSRAERITGIELLRIICMILIVAGHAFTHGGFEEIPVSLNGIFAIFISQGSRIGVDVFILITGYFAPYASTSISKIKRQYFQIWSYSAAIGIFSMFFGLTTLGKSTLLKSFLPITSSTYWFATDYFLLLLLMPALKTVVNNMEHKGLRNILICFGLMWCVLPSLHIGSAGFSEFAWLVYVAIAGAYFHLYPFEWMQKIKIWHGLLCLFMIMCLTALTYYIGYQITFFKENAIYLYGEMNTITGFLCAILLFAGFKNSSIQSNKLINRIARCTFGVYLLHDNPLIRKYIWQDLLQNNRHINEILFIPRMITSVAFVFLIGIIIEWIRQNTLNRITKWRMRE
ncbi:MAG: acyltransferase, partial [Eubacterium sp.]|nr:acyltransferase [Eubacterium sp.]